MKTSLSTYGLATTGAIEGAFKYYVQPELTAKRAWSALVIGTLAYELTCGEGQLMSEGADRFINKHPYMGRFAIAGLGLVITSHVANLVSEDKDLVSKGLKWLKDGT